MGVLHKYIFKQVLGAVIMTVALFVFVLVVGNVMKEVIGELASGKLGIGFFLYIVALIIPGVATYAMPLGMLTGILLVFGRMSAQSEVVAIKSLGKSVYSMAAGVILLAMAASVASVGINFYYAPAANSAYKGALRNLIRDNPLQFIQPGVFINEFPGFIIYANASEGKELLGFRIWELKDGKVSVAVQARRAALTYDDEKEEILLTLKDATAEWMNPKDERYLLKPPNVSRFEESPVSLSMEEILGAASKDKYKLSHMTYGELMDARTTWHPRPLEDTTPELAFQDRIKVQTQIQKNFAMAFSIISMAILAIPLGIKASRTETLANLAIAVALAMTYYMLTVFITWLEEFPHLRPDILIWLPNLLYQSLGAFLLWRSSKH